MKHKNMDMNIVDHIISSKLYCKKNKIDLIGCGWSLFTNYYKNNCLPSSRMPLLTHYFHLLMFKVYS